ncbi:glycerophosphodiester phosphodiesterase family protein [Roseovarius sp. ZX-A-9]|uniref:glycerophosphodiester phosphodiesterase family protein n=1 Tax=Roseovarius sp. ZX-A-9 TaxID=3014783 RepID=UPI00232C34CB|nr:glycerophosphodiester phosphodiesterase family protein [Roseovarius sp. ZX-A-9]
MSALSEAFRVVPVAHRALHDVSAGRPENSRAAIRAAIAADYGIEIDLQLSRDGRAMVFHDYELARLTGAPGNVSDMKAADLAQLRLTGGEESVPTLTEVLALVAGRVPLLIELKDQHGEMGGSDGRLERAVAHDIAGYAGPLALMSFNPHSVIELAGLCPAVPRGIVTGGYAAEDWPELPDGRTRARLRDIPDFEAASASFISHEVADLDRSRVAEIKAGGAAILCWTVRSAAQELQARRIAHNITFEGYLAAIPA